MKKKAVKELEKFGDLAIPIIKAAINIPTLGFGGAVIEAFQAKYDSVRNQNIDAFFREMDMKLKELGIKLDDTIKKRLGSPEFIHIITKILNRIQIETRKGMRGLIQIY